MGIHGLSKLIADTAPGVIKEQKFDNYFGRKIAIDASMHIYQFMVVVGRQGDQQLTNEAGEVTSHLQAGIKPVYVFDGKPPQMKKDELVKRFEKREDATEALAAAKEAGDTEAIEKFGKRTVKVTKEHNEECMRLLRLMGVPIVEAPSEAEAQCTAMCKSGMVYGVATEDMDALTFGTPRLIRHLMAPASQAAVVNEIDVGAVLEGLGLTMEQFIDVCILCGCDYCGTIRGIGAKTALKLIQKHGNIEKALASLDKGKYNVPDPFPYEEARRLFQAPEVVEPQNLPPLKWAACDEQGLVDFLVGEKNFSEDRIRSAVKKINAARGKASQGRLESFFGPATVKPGKAKAAEKDAAAKKSAAAGKKGGKLGVKGGVTKKVGKK